MNIFQKCLGHIRYGLGIGVFSWARNLENWTLWMVYSPEENDYFWEDLSMGQKDEPLV